MDFGKETSKLTCQFIFLKVLVELSELIGSEELSAE